MSGGISREKCLVFCGSVFRGAKIFHGGKVPGNVTESVRGGDFIPMQDYKSQLICTSRKTKQKTVASVKLTLILIF